MVSIRLRLQRAGPPLEGGRESAFAAALAAAAALLSDVAENGIELGLASGDRSRSEIEDIRTKLSARVWDVDLVGEAPLGIVHEEHSGWGLPSAVAPATRRLVAAVDALDWLAGAMGSADTLAVDVEAA